MSDLCQLADVKAYIGVTSTTSDVLLSRLITATSAQIEAWCGRAFLAADYTDIIDGDGSDYVVVRNRPLVSVTSLFIGSTEIHPSPDGIAAGYVFDSRSIYYLQGFFCRGRRNVKVTYNAGFASIPADVTQAAIALVAYHYQRGKHLEMKSETLSGQTTSYDLSGMPEIVTKDLGQYKVLHV